MSQNKFRKNPSRETCESIIRRILTAEIGERGKNEHFRQAADFMPYFESLYLASDSLTKQVQRAIKMMNLPLNLPVEMTGGFMRNRLPVPM